VTELSAQSLKELENLRRKIVDLREAYQARAAEIASHNRAEDGFRWQFEEGQRI
jgi:hypothetical protein